MEGARESSMLGKACAGEPMRGKEITDSSAAACPS